jgi:hypothetical protein
MSDKKVFTWEEQWRIYILNHTQMDHPREKNKNEASISLQSKRPALSEAFALAPGRG